MKFKYPAIKGLQAKRYYYIMMVPICELADLVSQTPSSIEDYYQRALNQARIPEIKRYILANRDSYVFSALTVSISGSFSYTSIDPNSNYGFLEADDDIVIKLNDGQHRKAALLAASAEDSSLKDETIAVVVFEDNGLKRSQQMFTDLNKNAVKSTNSLSTFFDSREPLSIYTTELVKNISILAHIIDVEKDIIGKNSMYFFSLNTLLKANKIVVGTNSIDESVEVFLYDFWNFIFSSIHEWDRVISGEITKQSFRDFYILHFNVTLYAIAKVGNYFFKNPDIDYKSFQQNLEQIDWTRENHNWTGSIFDKTGKVKTGECSINLLAIRIKQLMGIELSKEDRQFAKKLRMHK